MTKEQATSNPPKPEVDPLQAVVDVLKSGIDEDALVKEVGKLVREEFEKRTDRENNITRAARRIKQTNRAILVTALRTEDFDLLYLPVDNDTARALIEDRLHRMDEKWRSGVVGAVVGAVITGGFTLLVWWLQQGGPGTPGN